VAQVCDLIQIPAFLARPRLVEVGERDAARLNETFLSLNTGEGSVAGQTLSVTNP